MTLTVHPNISCVLDGGMFDIKEFLGLVDLKLLSDEGYDQCLAPDDCVILLHVHILPSIVCPV